MLDINKPIAISVAPDMRARVERLWKTYNQKSTIPVSKSAIYRQVLEQGVRGMEGVLSIAP